MLDRSIVKSSTAMWCLLVAGAMLTGCSAVSTRDQIARLEQDLLEARQDKNRLQGAVSACEGEKRAAQNLIDELQGSVSNLRHDNDSLRAASFREPASSQDLGATQSPGIVDDGDLEKFSGLRGVEAVRDDSGEIRLTLDQAILFSSGSATITADGASVLNGLSAILKTDFPQGSLRVAGHSDNTPVVKSKARFATNWELSAIRACSVLRYLLLEGAAQPSRCSIAGFGDQQPVAGNDTAAGKKANRRVEIFVSH